MAEWDGSIFDIGIFSGDTPSPPFKDTAIREGSLFNIEPASIGGMTLIYRMSGIDGTLGYTVYWFADQIDATGTQYVGPGPLTDICLTRVLCEE